MNKMYNLLFALLGFLFIGCSHDQHSHRQDAPYAGQENREIKALTTQEIEGYLNGMGMGLSLVAELNHYPGPRHVLELADQLELSDQQIEQTQALFNQMKKKAMTIGETYIAKERELNKMFETENVSSSTVDSLVVEIGKIKGTLRATHISTHIEMRNILTSEQIKQYDKLRGYGSDNTTEHSHSHS